ncbi:hypothetical protein [Lentzea sp. NPDC051838]|uniref:hypothetical protein n=1 Tax=Lentzea sp. NPDC051838 TaxID=3154849 RepID=UPI00342A8AC0
MKSLFHHRGLCRALSVAIALATGVAFGTAGATAKTAPADVPGEVSATMEKLDRSSQVFAEEFDQAGAGLAAELTGRARQAIASGQVRAHLPNGARFDAESATAYTSKGGGPSILRLPLAGPSLARPSVLGVTFDPGSGAVLFTTEMLITGAADNSAHVTVWNNGELALNKITTADGQVRESDAAPPVAFAAASDGFWSRLNDCLASLGIGWAVVTAIAVACSAACVVSAGTGCLLCILAAAGITNANIAGCVAEASQG